MTARGIREKQLQQLTFADLAALYRRVYSLADGVEAPVGVLLIPSILSKEFPSAPAGKPGGR